jgi:hypothetical protein
MIGAPKEKSLPEPPGPEQSSNADCRRSLIRDRRSGLEGRRHRSREGTSRRLVLDDDRLELITEGAGRPKKATKETTRGRQQDRVRVAGFGSSKYRLDW